MSEQKANVYAPTEVHVEDVVAPGEFEMAERITRLYAALVDGLIFGGMGILAAIFIPAMQDNLAARNIGLAVIVIFVLAMVGLNLYYLHQNGQTIGKKLLNIKIVRSNGERIGLGRIILLRVLPVALLGMVPFVGNVVGLVDVLLIFRASRQCLHDSIADTIVIKA